jgi:4-amino-4-deoxy-L-arabinose transferase-like glycosyltransferase
MISAGAIFGLAILTKSVAAFLFLPGLLSIMIAQHGVRFLHSKEIALAIFVALAVALPWHVASTATYGRLFLDQYFGFHIVGRFVRPLEGHEGSSFYYLETYFHNAGIFAPVHLAGISLAVGLAIVKGDRLLSAACILPLAAFTMVSLQATKIGAYLTPVCSGAALASALGIMGLVQNTVARVVVLLVTLLLALPGIGIGRGSFVETSDILVFSPEVRSLRNTAVFVNRVPLLYLLDVADPAPRFYLADRVEIIEQHGLERLIFIGERFLCLTYKLQADEFLKKHPHANLKIVASTEYLAVVEYR